MNNCIKYNKDCACCEILCKEAVAEHNKNIDQLKKELEQERANVERMRSLFNCGAFELNGKGHSEVACCEMGACPCDKWKLKE